MIFFIHLYPFWTEYDIRNSMALTLYHDKSLQKEKDRE